MNRSKLPDGQPRPAARIAAALRKVAARIEREWEDGQRSWAVDAGDLIEAFRAVADELAPAGRVKR